MIAIFLVYVGVAAAEWGYMRSKKRKTSTKVVVLASILALLLASEILYSLAGQFQLSTIIETLFGSFEQWIVGRKL